MAHFKYTADTKDGRYVEALFNAQDEGAARSDLRARGLKLISIERVELAEKVAGAVHEPRQHPAKLPYSGYFIAIGGLFGLAGGWFVARQVFSTPGMRTMITILGGLLAGLLASIAVSLLERGRGE